MKRTRIALLLSGVQVVVAVVLLMAERRQVPRVQQDFPPFVGSTAKIGWAINAPVMFLEGGILASFHKVGVEFGSRIWNLSYIAGVAFLWFLVGLEIESRIRKRSTRWRILVDCLAISLGVGLSFLALAVWRQAETILTTGSAIWALALIAIYGLELARMMNSRRTRNLGQTGSVAESK